MKKNNKTNYYVMDKCIDNSNSDEFGHESIANNIELLLENSDYLPPYNIALIGEWGLGKTSIVELIRKKYENNENYKVIEINAWKYEKESLKKECLKKMYEEISGKKVNNIQQLEKNLSKIFNSELAIEKKKNTFCSIMNFIREYRLLIFISFCLSFTWQLVHYISNGNSFSELFNNNILFLLSRYFNFYFEKVILTLFVPLTITFFQKNMQKGKNVFPLQIQYDNDYESMLSEMIKPNDKRKYIVIFDDIDRLSTKKIVEALDTLKIMMEINRCIFIVPFDDTILKSALNKNVVSQIDSEEQIIKSEFILDKLFQFRFYVPPLIYSDMKDYTLKLINEEATGLCNLIEENTMKEIVKKIFMYDGVHTPRQIKKIINAFSNNILLFFDRIDRGKINSNLNNKTGLLIIAKISILQSDFNEFYDKLFDDPNLCEKLVSSNNTKYENFPDIPAELRKYYSKQLKIKDEYIRLINFLSRTAYIKSDDLPIYLRCNEDKMSNIYGSAFNRHLLSYMQSMNFSAMNALFIEHKIEDINTLIIEYLEKEPIYNLPMIIISILNIDYDCIDWKKLSNVIASSITNVYKSDEKFDYKNVNIRNLLKIKEIKENDISITRLFDEYIVFLLDNIDDDTINHTEIFKNLNSKFEILSNSNVENVKNYLYKLCINDDNNVDFLDNNSLNDEYLKTYYGENLYNYLVENLDEYINSNSYEHRSNLIYKLYVAQNKSNNIKELNNKYIGLLGTHEHLELIDKIISNNVDKLSEENKNNIIEKISNLNEEKLILQFNIINIIKYDLSEPNLNFENKICQLIEKEYDVSDIVSAISNYELINNVILKINSVIYSNSKYDSFYQKNKTKILNGQKESLILRLSEVINIDSYIEGRMTNLLNIIGNDYNIDVLMPIFSMDEMIKNNSSSDEIINIINNNKHIISNTKIDSYINRIIELLPNNDELLENIWKLKKNINLENLKLLCATISDKFIDGLEENKIKLLLDIYTNIEITNDNKICITDTFNVLLNTTLYITVIKYMISNNLMISDSYNFIMNKLDYVRELDKIKELNKILIIDEQFINNIINSIKANEYSSEKIVYLASLSERIMNILINCENNYTNDDYIFLINSQKVVEKMETEKLLVEWQSNIIENGTEELLINLLEHLLKINNPKNKKIVKNKLEKRIEKSISNDLLCEKINVFCLKNGYRISKPIERELINS